MPWRTYFPMPPMPQVDRIGQIPTREEAVTTGVRRELWAAFITRIDWRPGEHVLLVGPTGLGKTTLAQALLRERERRGSHVCVVVTKPRDVAFAAMSPPYVRVEKWPPTANEWQQASANPPPRILLWPPFTGVESIDAQRDIIETAIGDMFRAGGWTLYIDELLYASNTLKLDQWLETLWQQGRSNDISFVAATQRPRHVPLVAYSSSTHLFVWRTSDDEDVRRLSGLGVANANDIRNIVPKLAGYDVLYVNTRTGALAVTRAPKPNGG